MTRFHILLTAALFWSCPGCRPARPPAFSWWRLGLTWMPLPHRLHPHGQAFAQLWGKRLGLRSTSFLRRRSLREHSVGWEWRWGWDGRENPVLSCRIPVCTGRDRPSVSTLLCSIGQHVVLNTFPLLPLLSQCPLCLCLVSGCLDPAGLLIQVS